MIYGRFSKTLNTLLFLFLNKMLVFRAGIHKNLFINNVLVFRAEICKNAVRIANSEDADQTASEKAV